MKKKFERKPLDPSTFPPNVQNHVKAESPPPMKMMAARGMVPAPPEVTVRVLYQLAQDQDNGVRAEAKKAAEEMPAEVMVPSLKVEQPPAVLDWLGELRDDSQILEAILLNKGTDDLTVAALAGEVNSKLCEVIANNQVRVLRSPVILEQLYKNPNARMSTVDKLIDLAQRNDVKLAGLPALQEALDSGVDIGIDPEADGSDDDAFASMLQKEVERAEQEEEADAAKEDAEEGLTRLEKLRKEERKEEEEEEEDLSDKPIFVQLQNMKISRKIRMATVGSREMAKALVKEANRLVHMAAIQNPRLKYADIKKLASNRAVSDNVIRFIANNREWTRHYDIILSLVNNPKTPISEAIGFLNHLRTNDLRQLQRNRNVPQQLARQAKNLVNKRTGRGRR